MYRKAFATILLVISFVCNYIIMHMPYLQPILIVGFPVCLLVQAWMLKVFDFYDNIYINIFANIIFMLVISIIQAVNQNDFFWYFKDKIDMTNFIFAYWILTSTMYFGLLFDHWFTKMLIPFFLQVVVCVILWYIAFSSFQWIDADNHVIKVKWWSVFVGLGMIAIVFWMNVTISKWTSKKLIIRKEEVR